MILYNNNIAKLKEIISSHTKVFLLLDENTEKYCLYNIKDIDFKDVIKIVIPSGEQHKNIETVQYIWSQLVENHADRKSLLINLGGGVVTDMGGFAASCYQRGIDFVNVPTTLLGMVDASIGGKTGIDFQGLKNQIGVFSQPLAVVILFEFLETLPKREMLSGLAEIIKYGFIVDKSFLETIRDSKTDSIDPALIKKAIEAKEEITSNDTTEQGKRKILNFGHTVGHALETYLNDNQQEIRHGEAVALGIIPALYLSQKYYNLSNIWFFLYGRLYMDVFNRFILKDLPVDELLEIIRHDKKNQGGDIRFVLISKPGEPVYDVAVKPEDVAESIRFLEDFMNNEDYWG